MKVLKVIAIAALLVAAVLAIIAPVGPLPGFFIGGTESSPPSSWPDTQLQ